MFLAQFSEEQKRSFMSLAHTVVLADNVLAQSEETMMAQYRQEMALPDGDPMDPVQAIKCLAAAANDVRKKVIFELLALACADGRYVPEEQAVLKKLQAAFGLDDAFMRAATEKLKKLLALYEELGQLVNG